MSIGLTPRQMELLRFIKGYQLAHGGISPSLSECADGIDAYGKSSVHALLIAMEQRGAIRRLPARARAIEVLAPVSVPMIGDEPLYAVRLSRSSLPRRVAARPEGAYAHG